MRKGLIFLLLGSSIIVMPATALHSSSGFPGDTLCKSILDEYVKGFLRRNPAVSTYRGGSGLDPSLREADGRLRDHSPEALLTEDRWLSDTLSRLERITPQSVSLVLRTDREVAIAQIRFLLRQHQQRRYQERALDTYIDEPFRAVDSQLQSMTPVDNRATGTEEEWELLIKRLESIPRYMAVARSQLLAGTQSNNTPDHRMLRRNGLDTAEADARYFETTLPRLAEERMAGNVRQVLAPRLREASQKAGDAYRELRHFIQRTFFDDPELKTDAAVKPQFRGDRFVLGEAEYNWALKNNLKISKTAAQLYEEAWPIVAATRRQMALVARRIGRRRGWKIPAEDRAAVRAVFDELSKEHPKSDDEMVEWYREAALRLVAYGKKTGIFEVPDDYNLEVAVTPPPLRASIDGAAYFPSPPFKNTGVGRFYVTPTGNNQAALRSHNRAALADLAAHEGFPGHDWHYKIMSRFRDEVSPIRWLTPGGIEDSSSMWQDSMAAEGWALYAEALMAESQPKAPAGFYTDEERLYQLQGKLTRDLRVRIDIGIHTGRLTYDDAVDLFSEVVGFLPGSCRNTAGLRDDLKRASCESAERAIFRYSKWPTQAITYRLGKDEIQALRREVEKLLGRRFSAQRFHLTVLKQGRIPVGYYREAMLQTISEQNKVKAVVEK